MECVDLDAVDAHDLRELVQMATGLVLGMPAQSNRATAHTALSSILAAVRRKQTIGLFE